VTDDELAATPLADLDERVRVQQAAVRQAAGVQRVA
jgi:hypothetical protein